MTCARATLALVGMRGAGKTTVGRALAEELSLPFLDLDEATLEFAAHAGVHAADVPALFASAGEARFREFEAFALRRVLEPGVRCVLATGGGVVERPDNRTWLARAAFVVWLDAAVATLEERIAAGGASRPALRGADVVAEVAALAAHRRPLYAALANVRFATDEGVEPPELAQAIAARFSAGGD
jgi:shikimate kinase